jgi:hypothetical protein
VVTVKVGKMYVASLEVVAVDTILTKDEESGFLCFFSGSEDSQ